MNWAIELKKKYQSSKELANIYGIILYTDSNPHVKKMLNDDDYWKALNDISGDQWAIFSIKTKQGKYNDSNHLGINNGFGFMVSVWKEPNENKKILNDFEIPSTKDLPLLLVFTQENNGEILKISFKIDDSNVENAYNSLKKTVQLLTNAIENISTDNKQNPLGVYQAVRFAADNYLKIEYIKKGLTFYTWIKSIFL